MGKVMDLKIILDLLQEVREDQKEHGKELSKQSVYLENMDADVKELKASVNINTADIAHHIRRTDILEDLHKDNQARIVSGEARLEKLEEPVKAKAWFKKHMIAISAIITALVSIAAMLLNK
jgi:hypothetical protein